MFVCPNCQSENRETAKFCRRCGRARDEDAAEGAAESDKDTAKGSSDENKTKSGSGQDTRQSKGSSKDAEASQGGASTAKQQDSPEPAPPEMSQLMAAGSSQCPSCWSAVRASDRFCCWCGQEQPARLLPYFKVCLDCSTHLPEKANFCFSCGTDVSHQSRRKVTVPYELFQEEDSELFPRFEV